MRGRGLWVVRVPQFQVKESKLYFIGWHLSGLSKNHLSGEMLKCGFLGSIPIPGICIFNKHPGESYAGLSCQMLLKVSGRRAMLSGILFMLFRWVGWIEIVRKKMG